MFKPIKPKRISDQVFEQLKDLIFRGHLKPGDKLMTERDLAQQLGVSRPTVREAINKLVAMGLLEHRQGQGTFVRSPRTDSEKGALATIFNDSEISLIDLLEVRLGLECNAVALAAQRATEEDVRELDLCLVAAQNEIEEGGLGSDADLCFHMAIAYATKNQVQIHIMRSFYDLLFYGIKENLLHLYTDPDNLKKILEQHARVLECIRHHDPQGASEAMRQHITFVMGFFKELQNTAAATAHRGQTAAAT